MRAGPVAAPLVPAVLSRFVASNLITRGFIISSVVLASLGLTGFAAAALAQEEPPTPAEDRARDERGNQSPDGRPIQAQTPARTRATEALDLVDAPIERLAEVVAEAVGKPLTVEAEPFATAIDWFEPTTPAPSDLLTKSNEVLRLLGRRLVEREDALVLVAVPPGPGDDEATGIVRGTGLRPDAPAATSIARILPVVSRWPAGTLEALGSLLPEQASVARIAGGDALVIVASAAEASRFARVVEALDRIGMEGDAAVLPLRRVGAGRAHATLSSLFEDSVARGALRATFDELAQAVVLRGSPALLDEAKHALDLIDADAGGAASPASSERNGERVFLRIDGEHAAARIEVARAMLPRRLREATRFAISPDERAILLRADRADVGVVMALLGAIDSVGDARQSAHTFRLGGGDDAARDGAFDGAAIMRAVDEWRARISPRGGRAQSIEIAVDADAREILAIGARSDVARLAGVLRETLGRRAIARERAMLALPASGAAPESAFIESLAVRTPASGARSARVARFDELGIAVLDARAGGVAVARAGLASIEQSSEFAAMAVETRVPSAEARSLLERALERTASLRESLPAPLSAEFDEASGSLRLRGDPRAVAAIEHELAVLRGLQADARAARLIPSRMVAPSDTAAALRAFIARGVPIATARTVPPAEVGVLDARDAVVVEGVPAQIALLGRLAESEQGPQHPALSVMRPLVVRCTDVEPVVRRLRERFDARPEEEAREFPVLIEMDASTEVLAIAFHRTLLPEVADAIDAAERAANLATVRPRETLSTTLVRSDPETVARALNRLFEPGRAPRDERGRALVHLRAQREHLAVADTATRMVWLESWRESPLALQTLITLLDRMALGPGGDVRVLRVERGDLGRIVQNLRDLAARGQLSSRPPGDAEAIETRIEADLNTRTVVVAGDRETCARAEDVLRQLTGQSDDRGVRVIDVGDADPEAIRARAWTRSGTEPARGADGNAEVGVAATVDARRGTIAAIGAEADLERFVAACLASIPMQERRHAVGLIPLRTGASSVLGAPIASDIGSDRTLDAATLIDQGKAAIVGGPRTSVRLLGMLSDVLAGLDAPVELRALRRPCIEPQLVATAIAGWFAARPEDDRRRRPLAVEACADGDGLLVVAHPDMLPDVDAITRAMSEARERDPRARERGAKPGANLTAQQPVPSDARDPASPQPLTAGDAREWRVIPVPLGRATELASMLRSSGATVEVGAAAVGDLDAGGAIGADRDARAILLVEADSTQAALLASCAGALADGMPRDGVAAQSWRIIRDASEDVSATTPALRPLAKLQSLALKLREIAPDARIEIDLGARGSTLVAAGAPDTLDRIARQIEASEAGVEPSRALRIIPVESAHATGLASIVERALGQEGADESTTLRVLAEPSARSISLAGAPALVGFAEEVIRTLDVATREARRETVHLHPVRSGDAGRVAAELAARVPGASVRSLSSARAIVVRADDASREGVLRALEDLGVEAAPAVAPLVCELIDLAHVAPDAAAAVIDAVVCDRARWPEELRADAQRSVIQRPPCVQPFLDSTSVVVVAPPRLADVATRLALLIDTEQPPGRRVELRAYPLAGAAVGRALEAAQQALDARAKPGIAPPATLVDLSAGGLLVALGEPSWLDAVDAAVRSVDVRALRDAARARTMSARHASPRSLARVIGPLLTAIDADDARGAAEPDVPRELAPARIVFDERGGTVTAIASPMTLDLAEEILVELDHESLEAPRRSFRLYEIAGADAAVVAKAIVDRFELDDPGEEPPSVRLQPARNGLLVRASDAQRTVIRRLVESMLAKAEVPAAITERMLGVQQLAIAPAEVDRIFAVLSEMRANTAAARPASGDAAPAAATPQRASQEVRESAAPVALSLDRDRGLIACFATPAAVARNAESVRQLARLAPADDAVLRRLALPPSANPLELAALAIVACERLAVDDGGLPIGDRVAIAADPAAAGVLVLATPRDAAIVRELLAALAQVQRTEPVVVRRLVLAHAEADRVAEALRFVAARADGLPRVAVAPDRGGVVVMGRAAEVAAASRLAARFDRSAAQARDELRVLPLRSIDANDAASILGLLCPQNGPTPVIEVASRSSIVLQGEASILDMISAPLAELDKPGGRLPPAVEVLPVARRAAGEVAAEIAAALAAADEGRRERIRIVASDAANTLFVRADAELLAEVRALLALLDR